MSSSRYDVVIFTARKEEMFFLHKAFLPTPDDLYPEVARVEPKEEWANLQVGLVNLNAMGNVMTAIKASEVLERVLPRTVIMVGLAAGYEPRRKEPVLRKGDVGVGKQIFYHSYGKIWETQDQPDIRDLPDVPPPAGLEWVEGQLNDANWLTKVQDCVQTWFADEHFGVRGWLSEIVDAKDQRNYAQQNPPNRDIRIRAISVSSGEQVIASRRYVEHVRDQLKRKDITMFDMESFALGRVCLAFQVPFFVIKGISDYADSPRWPTAAKLMTRVTRRPATGKADNDRWRAIAAASAACRCLLTNGYRTGVVGKSQAIRPRADRLHACLHPKGDVICRYRNGDLRKCVHPGRMLKDATTAWLCRTFEDMSPPQFSKRLQIAIETLVRKESAVLTTFFPYSPRDLLEIFRRDPALDRKSRDTVDALLNNNHRGSPHSAVRELTKLVDTVRDNYGHFVAYDTVCNAEGIKPIPFSGGQPQVARIVLFQTPHRLTDAEIVDDPLNVIYPLLLGKSVPTYYAVSTVLVREGEACVPDATFIDRRSRRPRGALGEQTEGDFGDLVALRFFEDSHTLLVSGLPCNDVSGKEGLDTPAGLQRLYSLWQDWCKGIGNKSFFAQFPIEDLLNRYNLPRRRVAHVPPAMSAAGYAVGPHPELDEPTKQKLTDLAVASLLLLVCDRTDSGLWGQTYLHRLRHTGATTPLARGSLTGSPFAVCAIGSLAADPDSNLVESLLTPIMQTLGPLLMADGQYQRNKRQGTMGWQADPEPARHTAGALLLRLLAGQDATANTKTVQFLASTQLGPLAWDKAVVFRALWYATLTSIGDEGLREKALNAALFAFDELIRSATTRDTPPIRTWADPLAYGTDATNQWATVWALLPTLECAHFQQDRKLAFADALSRIVDAYQANPGDDGGLLPARLAPDGRVLASHVSGTALALTSCVFLNRFAARENKQGQAPTATMLTRLLRSSQSAILLPTQCREGEEDLLEGYIAWASICTATASLGVELGNDVIDRILKAGARVRASIESKETPDEVAASASRLLLGEGVLPNSYAESVIRAIYELAALFRRPHRKT